MGLPSDERLARCAAQGDRRAFEAIYRRYHQPLYRFCLAMVGNSQDAQDALQNTMVKALRSLPGEQRQIRLKPWLYRVARNESVEVLRRRRESDELDPELKAPGGVAEAAETRERLRDLLGDLELLPGRQRSVLLMRELSGLAFAEIGEAFDTSAAVARQTLYEARLNLRRLEAGREMHCADVTRELSDADDRVIRRREVRAHLRSCADCRAFDEGIGRRRDDLAAIAPLPLAASAGLLQGVLGAQAGVGASGSGLTGTLADGAGKAAVTSTAVKSVAVVAVATVVGVSAADRSGLVDTPLPGGGRSGDATTEAPLSPGKPNPAASLIGGERAGEDAGKPANVKSQVTMPEAHPDDATKGGSDPAEAAGRPESAPPDPVAGTDLPGTSPPGGGYGRSAAERRGRPDGLPQAAERGQSTAAARRPAHAGRPPTQGSATDKGSGKGSGGSGPSTSPPPKAKPIPAPVPPPQPPHPLAPPAERNGPPVETDVRPVTPPGQQESP